MTPEFVGLVPGFFSTDVEESVRSLKSLLRICFAQAPSADELYLMLGFNVSVPPYVRQALLSRSLDNDDVLARIRKPALITHGAQDSVVKPIAADQHRARLLHAQVDLMANAGHAPFWESAAAFNARLRKFSAAMDAAPIAGKAAFTAD